MQKNQNIQGIVSKKGNVKAGNFTLEDNKITASSEAENIQGVSAELDVEVLGDISIQRNEVIIQQIYQQLVTETESQITNSLSDKEITSQDQKIINQTILFLGTKELFINYRQQIINNLIETYCKFANKKYAKFARTADLMGITGKIAKAIPSGGAASASMGIVGDIASLTGTLLQEKNLKKCLKEFQEILKQDQENLALFHTGHQSLTQTIWPSNEPNEIIKNIIGILKLERMSQRIFTDNYGLYQTGGAWEANFANSTPEQLKEFLTKLDENLKKQRIEFETQRNQLTEQEWFKAIEQQTDLLQEQKIQTQVEVATKD
jgi:hypothetical protein